VLLIVLAAVATAGTGRGRAVSAEAPDFMNGFSLDGTEFCENAGIAAEVNVVAVAAVAVEVAVAAIAVDPAAEFAAE
jgi:hypothetical protein